MPLLRPRVTGGDVVGTGGRIQINASLDKEGLLSAITKWIPIEVIGIYQGLTTPFGDKLANFFWQALTVGLVVAFLWIGFATEDAKKRNRIAWRQALLAPVALFFWAFGTTSPDILKTVFGEWDGAYGLVALAIGAAALPIFDGIMHRLKVPQD